MIELEAKLNLTAQRIDKLSAVKCKDFPFKDAIVIVRWNGPRKLRRL